MSAPNDVGFATLGWSETAPEQTGIRQNWAKVAAAAIDLVIAQLQRNDRGIPDFPKTTLIEGTWMPGTTVRASSIWTRSRPRP